MILSFSEFVTTFEILIMAALALICVVGAINSGQSILQGVRTGIWETPLSRNISTSRKLNLDNLEESAEEEEEAETFEDPFNHLEKSLWEPYSVTLGD